MIAPSGMSPMTTVTMPANASSRLIPLRTRSATMPARERYSTCTSFRPYWARRRAASALGNPFRSVCSNCRVVAASTAAACATAYSCGSADMVRSPPDCPPAALRIHAGLSTSFPQHAMVPALLAVASVCDVDAANVRTHLLPCAVPAGGSGMHHLARSGLHFDRFCDVVVG